MLLPEIGTVFEGKYKLESKLGNGGFASAFLAEDMETNIKVVLKFPEISQLGDPAVYERFRREMAIGKLLNHPDLPVALAYSEDSPPYLVIRYAEGELLSKVIEEKGTFPAAQAIEMVANLLDALQYCHQQGVYHRDLKPENLLLSSDGRLKVIDFGIAVMEGAPRVTWRGFSGLMGTPEYMSPEQIKGERGGAKSDIYATGCLLYHLLSGKPPFTGDNPMTTMYQHMTANPRPLTEIRKELHPGIWASIKKALRRRKEERYDIAAEMADDLRHPEKADLKWLNQADPPFISVQSNKRNIWIITGAAILLAVVLALALTFFGRR